MRILHVTHELPPYELAGTAIYSLNIARAQAVHHEVFVFARLHDTTRDGYAVHTEVRDGCTIRFVNRPDIEWSPFENSYCDPKMQGIFTAFLEEVEPDVVHFQHVVGLGVEVLDVVRQKNITSLFTLHDFWAMCPMGQRMCYTDHVICDPIDFGKCGPCVFGEGYGASPSTSVGDGEGSSEAGLGREPTLRQRYERRYRETPGRFARRPRAALRALQGTLQDRLRPRSPATTDPVFSENPFQHRFNVLRQKLQQIDLLITPSAFLRDEFMKIFGVPPDRIIHSANGMDFSYVKALPKTPSPRLRFGYMGSIIPTKGVRVLVQGFIQAAQDRDDIALEIFGAPNRWTQGFLDELKATAAESPCADQITFHGRYDNTRVSEVLQQMDVLVLPSIWFENAPLTLNEAAMSATPIIVSDRGGMLEFARANHYGRTFELGNPQALAQVIREVAQDRSKLAAMTGTPPPIKSVRANGEELVAIYHALTQKRYVPPTLEEQTRSRGGCLTPN